MKNFIEIKKELLEKNFSKKEISFLLFTLNLAKVLLTETFLAIISLIPFAVAISIFFEFSAQIVLFYLIGHFLFYTFYLKKEYRKEILPAYNEVKMTIKALKEIKAEK